MYEKEIIRNLKEPEITLWTCRKCGCNEFSFAGKKNHNCIESLAKTGRKFGGLTGKQIVRMTEDEIKALKSVVPVEPAKAEDPDEDLKAEKTATAATGFEDEEIFRQVCISVRKQLKNVNTKAEYDAICERFKNADKKYLEAYPDRKKESHPAFIQKTADELKKAEKKFKKA